MAQKSLRERLRRLAALACLAVALLLGPRLAGRAAGGLSQERWKDLVRLCGSWLVEQAWSAAHPVPERDPYEKRPEGLWEDPDPSYRRYQAVKTFYEEHEYLAWYGDENTNASASQPEGGSSGSGQPGAALPAGAALKGKTDLPLTGTTYVMEQLADYDFLMRNFYSVHTSTTAGRDVINAQAMLEKDLSIEKGAEGPQILIYHTHSQEAFADSGPGQTVTAVGAYLARLLKEKGYGVYHDTSVYDLVDGKLDRSKAYTYAGQGIEKILEENPSIEVILDIHRDGVAEDLRLVTEIGGKPTAKIMFFNGMSQTPDGPVEYLENPYRQENLAFSFQMQLDAQAYFPGYTRKIYLKGLRYNLHLRPRSALIEVGAQTNTFEEAKNAMEPLAELLDMVLQGD